MTEKEAILRDLKVIAILDKKINYSDRDNIGAVLELNPKSLFSTEYGERYLKRIRQMYNGEEYDHTCILCGDKTDGDNPVCKNCYTMITIGAGRAPEAPKPLKTSEEQQPEQGEAESSVEEQQTDEQAESASEKTEEADQVTETEDLPETQPVGSEAHPEESLQSETEEPAAEALTESPEDESEEKSEEIQEEIEAVEPEESPEEEQIERLDDSEVTEEDIDDTAPEEIIEEAEKEESGEKESYDGPDFAADFSKKSRHLDLARALILLFVVACFTIAIVCGMILILRDIRIKKQNSQVESRVVTDADLVDYYSIERNTYTYTVKDES